MRYGYRHTAGVVLVLLLFFAGCTMTLAQTVDSTGNLVNPTTWTNGVNQNELTCWKAGDPGYCGPNPIIRPDGNINYSYGLTNIYQERSLTQALPYSGTGLVVSGWNFTYTAKIGNGWDDGRYDLLQSYVQLRDGNTVKDSFTYTHATTHDWTTFSHTQTYDLATKRYTTDNITDVRYGFIGQDYNYWAGPYGPEIRDVSFSLQYRRDPCADSQLSSPLCPRFMETLSQMSTIAGITSTPAIPVLPAVSGISEQSDLTAATSLASTTGSSNSSQSSNGSSSVNASAQSFALSVIRSNQQRETRLGSSASATAMAEAEAAAEAAQRDAESRAEAAQTAAAQAAAETATVQSGSAGQVTTTTTIPGFIVNVPQALAPTSQSVNNESAAQQSTNVTVIIQSQPVTNTATLFDIEQPQPPSVVTAAVRMIAPNAIRSQDAQEQSAELAPVVASPVIVSPVIESTVVDVGSLTPPTATATVQQANVTPAAIYTPPASTEVSIVNTTPAVEIAIPVIQVASPISMPMETAQADNPATSSTNFTTNRTNPITEIVEQRSVAMAGSAPVFSGPAVNTRAQDNELAGSVSIDSIAREPAGFDVYASLTLRDAAFYAPREIYRGQRNVDNRRALSNLAQEGRHREMVDQQYRR